jgi:hypothetical protein
MLETIWQALVHTPWWVYVLFVYLMFVGFSATKTQVVPLTRVVILPIIFTWMSIETLTSTLSMTLFNVSAWIIATAIGIILGWLMVIKKDIHVDKKKWLLEIPGSSMILILILIIFASKYYFSYTLAVQPESVTKTDFVLSLIGVSGIVTGLFIGRFLCFVYFMNTKLHEELFLK